MNSIKSVVSGLFVYLAGSILTAIFVGFISSIVLSGYPQAGGFPNSMGPFVLIVMRLLFVFIGGFVAGRIAIEKPVAHGFILGVIALFLGLLFEGVNDTWFDTVSLILIVPLASWGASIVK